MPIFALSRSASPFTVTVPVIVPRFDTPRMSLRMSAIATFAPSATSSRAQSAWTSAKTRLLLSALQDAGTLRRWGVRYVLGEWLPKHPRAGERAYEEAKARIAASRSKLYGSEMVGRVADRAIQVFGGNGYMTEMGVERWARFVRAMRLYEGTSEILKTNIAKTLGLDEPTRVPAAALGSGASLAGCLSMKSATTAPLTLPQTWVKLSAEPQCDSPMCLPVGKSP